MMSTGIVRRREGFSLVEVTLALGVASFCLLALFGLLPIGVSSNQTSVEQTAAASVAASIVADLRATPLTSATSAQYAIPVPPASSPTFYTLFLRDDGSMAQVAGATSSSLTGWSANLAQNPRYRATLVFTPPAANQLGVTPVRVLVTWPAVADPTVATSLTQNFPSKFSGSFEVVTALDRN